MWQSTELIRLELEFGDEGRVLMMRKLREIALEICMGPLETLTEQ